MDSAGSTRSSNRPVSRRGGGETMVVDSPVQFRPVTRGGRYQVYHIIELIGRK